MTAAVDLFGQPELERAGSRQLPLPLGWRARLADSPPLLVTDALHALIGEMVAWQRWAAPVAVLYGPPRSGKSLLAEHIVHNSGTISVLDPICATSEAIIFHACNTAMAGNRPVLLVAEHGWQPSLPDLVTRISAAQIFVVPAPDTDLLANLLSRRLAERQILLPQDTAEFAAMRMERSFTALDRLCDQLTRHWQTEPRPLSIPRVRSIIHDMLAAQPLHEVDAEVA